MEPADPEIGQAGYREDPFLSGSQICLILPPLNYTAAVCEPDGKAVAAVRETGMSIARDGQRFDL
jgi:hypothetical protein